MKRDELVKHTTCSACRKPVLSSGLPLFWRVRVERFGVDLPAMRRATGLATAIGSAAIAAVLGPDEDLAAPILGEVTLTLCETCAMEPQHVAALAMGDRG